MKILILPIIMAAFLSACASVVKDDSGKDYKVMDEKNHIIIDSISQKFDYENPEPDQNSIPVPLVFGKAETFSYQTATDTDLNPELVKYLDKIVEYYKNNPQIEIRVTGHSDNSLSSQKNFDLSKQRAQLVADYLISSGIPRRSILQTGRGATNPIAGNSTEEGRRKNRRVEIIVIAI